MPDVTYYAPGEWNYICDLCGGSFKSSTSMQTWDGFRVCQKHKEARNPQDFARGAKAEAGIPWSRPPPAEVFIQSSFRLLLENGSAMLQENLSHILRT